MTYNGNVYKVAEMLAKEHLRCISNAEQLNLLNHLIERGLIPDPENICETAGHDYQISDASGEYCSICGAIK